MTGEGFEEVVVNLRSIEVPYDNEIMVLAIFLFEPGVDPVSQHLQFSLAASDTVTPTCMGCDSDEVKVPSPEGTHVRSTPERLLSQEFFTGFGSRGIYFCRQTVEGYSPTVVKECCAFVV